MGDATPDATHTNVDAINQRSDAQMDYTQGFQPIDASFYTTDAVEGNQDFETDQSPANQEVQPVDAKVDASEGASNADAPESIELHLDFPITLKQAATALEISYNTLRNKIIGRLETAYEGLDIPEPIRNVNKTLTLFGFEALKAYLKSVGTNLTHDQYAEALRGLYPLKSETIEAEVVEDSEPGQMIVSTRDFLGTLAAQEVEVLPTRAYVSSEATVSAIDGKLANLMAQSSQFENQTLQALLNQAVQDGDQIGALLGQAKIAAAQRKQNQMLEDYAKKQGLAGNDESEQAGS